MHHRVTFVPKQIRSRIKDYKTNRNIHVHKSSIPKPNPRFVDARHAPNDFSPESAIVFDNVVSENDGEALLREISSRMKRRRYERSHWDSVITGYKEIELPHPHDMQIATDHKNNKFNISEDKMYASDVSEECIKTILLIRRILESYFFSDELSSLRWLPCHAIDLKKDGVLSAHVDSVKFSGDIVAGLSLASSSIMRLKPDKDSYQSDSQDSFFDSHVDLYLPPLSLYVLSGVGRYKYTHELLPSGASFSSKESPDSVEVVRDQRYSIIFRDAKK